MAAEMLVDLISCDVERNRKTRVQLCNEILAEKVRCGRKSVC